MPNRPDSRVDIDTTTHPAMMTALPTDEDRDELAAAYVASRARALGWTRGRLEDVIRALFQPPRGVTEWERHNNPKLFQQEPTK